MIVYLDTCAVQRPLDELSQLQVRVEADIILALIAAIEAGGIQLASSDMLRFEIENNPVTARRNFGRRVLALATVDTATTPEVAVRAKQYEKSGIKPLDAVHLASAVEIGADFFCTTDGSVLRKRVKQNTEATRIVSPSELITELTR